MKILLLAAMLLVGATAVADSDRDRGKDKQGVSTQGKETAQIELGYQTWLTSKATSVAYPGMDCSCTYLGCFCPGDGGGVCKPWPQCADGGGDTPDEKDKP